MSWQFLSHNVHDVPEDAVPRPVKIISVEYDDKTPNGPYLHGVVHSIPFGTERHVAVRHSPNIWRTIPPDIPCALVGTVPSKVPAYPQYKSPSTFRTYDTHASAMGEKPVLNKYVFSLNIPRAFEGVLPEYGPSSITDYQEALERGHGDYSAGDGGPPTGFEKYMYTDASEDGTLIVKFIFAVNYAIDDTPVFDYQWDNNGTRDYDVFLKYTPPPAPPVIEKDGVKMYDPEVVQKLKEPELLTYNMVEVVYETAPPEPEPEPVYEETREVLVEAATTSAPQSPPPAITPVASPPRYTEVLESKTESINCVMGTMVRSYGPALVPQTYDISVKHGEVKLDLSMVPNIAGMIYTIRINTYCSALFIRLPEGVIVTNKTEVAIGTLSEQLEHKSLSADIKVAQFVILGNVTIGTLLVHDVPLKA